MRKYLPVFSGFLLLLVAYFVIVLVLPSEHKFPFPGALEYGFLLGLSASLGAFALILKLGLKHPHIMGFVLLGMIFRFFLLGIWSVVLYFLLPEQLPEGLLSYAGSIVLIIFYEVFYLIKKNRFEN